MGNQDNRRRYPRVPLTTCATLSRGTEEIGVFRVLNLSAGGALLEGYSPGPIGHELTARFHFSPFEVVVGAIVVRTDANPRRSMFALNFDLMAPEARECVQSLVLAMREQAHAATALIVVENGRVGQKLRGDLGEHGHDGFVVTSAFEAVQLLGEEHRFGVAFVDQLIGRDDGQELLAYLADEHPEVGRILVAECTLKAGLRLACPPRAQLSSHGFLPKPWTDETLMRVLGR